MRRFAFPQIWSATFNVGDSCITFGVTLPLISSVFRARRDDALTKRESAVLVDAFGESYGAYWEGPAAPFH
jgi:hypothetical protein